jgi:hypothetical protein
MYQTSCDSCSNSVFCCGIQQLLRLSTISNLISRLRKNLAEEGSAYKSQEHTVAHSRNKTNVKYLCFKMCREFHHLDLSDSGPGSLVGIATGYGPGGPGIESRWGARFSAPVQTAPGAHPASCTMGTGSFPGVESGRCVTLTSHPLLVPRSKTTA